MPWSPPETRPEANQLLPVERKNIGLQRLEAAPLYLGARGRHVVVGPQRRPIWPGTL